MLVVEEMAEPSQVATADLALIDFDTTWASLGLDARVQKAISNLGWKNPTLVQAKCIPLAMQGS